MDSSERPVVEIVSAGAALGERFHPVVHLNRAQRSAQRTLRAVPSPAYLPGQSLAESVIKVLLLFQRGKFK